MQVRRGTSPCGTAAVEQEPPVGRSTPAARKQRALYRRSTDDGVRTAGDRPPADSVGLTPRVVARHIDRVARGVTGRWQGRQLQRAS